MISAAVPLREASWALALVFRGAPLPALPSLREEMVKQAFRRRARDTHPDRACMSGRSEGDLARDFRDLRRAYETLLQFLQHRQSVPVSPPQRRPPPRASRPPRPGPPPTRPAAPQGSYGSRTSAPPPPPPSSPPPLAAANLPRRPLLLAEYLHLSGLISWQQRIAAIVWQRRQRPAIGQLAIRWGYLAPWQVEAVLGGRQAGERFGEAAMRLGWLTRFQCGVLVGGQRRSQQPIGGYFIEQRILSPLLMDRALRAFAAHNARWPASHPR